MKIPRWKPYFEATAAQVENLRLSYVDRDLLMGSAVLGFFLPAAAWTDLGLVPLRLYLSTLTTAASTLRRARR